MIESVGEPAALDLLLGRRLRGSRNDAHVCAARLPRQARPTLVTPHPRINLDGLPANLAAGVANVLRRYARVGPRDKKGTPTRQRQFRLTGQKPRDIHGGLPHKAAKTNRARPRRVGLGHGKAAPRQPPAGGSRSSGWRGVARALARVRGARELARCAPWRARAHS